MGQKIVIFTDADNTLWDTNKVYADAQLALLRDVEQASGLVCPSAERLEFLREYDQAIAAVHHAGLRYPPRLLCQSLMLGLQGTNPKDAFRQVWSGSEKRSHLSTKEVEEIERRFLEKLGRKPQLREGVQDGLTWFKEHSFPVLVVTEGIKKKVLDLVSYHDLTNLVDKVIEGRKAPPLYKRILRLMNDPDKVIMIGDQLDKDIAPAQEAGLIGVYFPGGFMPSWIANKPGITPDYEIESFDELCGIVDRL